MYWYEYSKLCDRELLSGWLKSGMTIAEIAGCVGFGCTAGNVKTALRNHGLGRPVIVRVSEETKSRLRL